jgi:toluene monooxygenase system protein E
VSQPRPRKLRTWSAFGELGRRPTEYEILTHGLNHTMRATPLELGPETVGNRWLRDHRDSMALTVPDWDAFRDPDAVTYGRYVAMQDDQETYVEGLLERFDREGEDERLTPPALEYLAAAVTPGRYLAHGLQMLSAYLQQLAPSSYIATCATFQTADQLRRVQLLAYRTTQLQRTHPDASFGTGERAIWQEHPRWQPVRSAVERALVAYDWDEALVATQLVVKPVADLLFLHQTGPQLAAFPSTVDSLIADNLWLDAQRSQRWTAALLRMITEADPANRSLLQAQLSAWVPRGRAMVTAASGLVATATGRSAAEIATTVEEQWRGLVESAGLVLDPVT